MRDRRSGQRVAAQRAGGVSGRCGGLLDGRCPLGAADHRVFVRRGRDRVWCWLGGAPPRPQRRQGQVGGQPAAAEPHRLPLGVHVPGGRHRVADQVPRWRLPRPHEHTEIGQPPEELLRVLRLHRGGPRGTPQPCPAGLVGAAPGCLLLLRPGRLPRRGAVRRRGRGQPEAALGVLAHLPGAQVVAPGVYSAAGVLAHEHHRDVDVVLGVPDSDPAAGAGVVTTGQAGAVQQVLDNLGPLRIRQHPVARGVAQRAVPHRTAAAGVMAVAGGSSGTPAASAGSLRSSVSPRTSKPHTVPLLGGWCRCGAPSQVAMTR